MAIGTPSLLGVAATKTAGAGLPIVTDEVTPVGDAIQVLVSYNNSATVDGPVTEMSVTDDAGNTYLRAEEQVETAGAADDGSHVALFYCEAATTQLGSGANITVTDSASEEAKAAVAYRVPFDGDTLELEDSVTAQDHDTGLGAISLSGLTNTEKLFIHGIGQENNSGVTTTWDSDYTEIGEGGTTGGGAATNQRAVAAYRILTGTGDTPTGMSNSSAVGAHVQILAAFIEVSGGGGTPQELAASFASVRTFSASLSTPKRLAASFDSTSAFDAELSTPKRLAASFASSRGFTAALSTPKRLAATFTSGSVFVARLTVGTAVEVVRRARNLLGVGR